MLAPRLRNYKHKSDYLWNFSCPICGDSSKSKTKARGYIYKANTGLFVKCHNCGYGSNLGNLIKYVDPAMYEEYVLENYKQSGVPRSHHSSTEVAIPSIISRRDIGVDSILQPLKSLDRLRPDHPAVKYVLNRKIPTRFLSMLYFAPKFKKFVNTVIAGKFDADDKDHPRLIIPYFNRHGKCFAFQARAFGNEQPKYYTIKVDDSEERIFGLDRVNFAKRIYVTEGPLDSLFIPNAIAVSGSTFNTPTIESLKSNATIVYDNEPRSKQLTKLIDNTIEQGFSVCLWPESVTEKDINEMVLAGRTPQQILDIINENTYTGAEAKLRFATWRKC
jgi:transcription elongation factor Elf1